MRIILDECVPVRLRHELPGHEVETVLHMGWASIKNGKLMRLIAGSGQFDIFLTVDKNLPQQQHLQNLPFAVVVLRPVSSRIEDVRLLIPEFLSRITEFQPGHLYVLQSLA